MLGVGTDIAGSIRIPALCCGVYGFKPTTGRVPYRGQASPSLPGLTGIVPAAGPLATSVSDLKLFFKSVLEAKPWMDDSTVVAAPYQIIANKELLTIGIFPEDPQLPLHPPVRRALDNAVFALTAAGHKLVQIPSSEATSASAVCNLAIRFYSMDPKRTGFQNIFDSGEPMINSVAAVVSEYADKGGNSECSILDVATMNVERWKYQESWREIYLRYNLDVVITPAAQHTAVKHDTYGLPAYTSMWNLLDVSLAIYLLLKFTC